MKSESFLPGGITSFSILCKENRASLKEKDLAYQIKEENLAKELEEEKERAEKLEEERIYVQTKEYIEKVAKEKLGLVKPDEILLKPAQ